MGKKLSKFYDLVRKPLMGIFTLSLVLQLFPLQGMAYAAEMAQEALGTEQQEQPAAEAPAPEPEPEPAPAPEPEPAQAAPAAEPTPAEQGEPEQGDEVEPAEQGEPARRGDGSEGVTPEEIAPEDETVEPTRGGEGDGAKGDEEEEKITVTIDPTTDPNEPLAPITVEVVKGQPIGDQLPTVPDVPGYRPKWVIKDSSPAVEVKADTIVNEPITVVVDKGEKITYTVTFVQEDGTTETRTTSIDEGFAVDDLPEVAPKTNKVGKWVYPGTTNEFTVGTVVSEDLTVNAYYEQNIFTVTFMVGDAIVDEMTTATGTTIQLPSDPIKPGATFNGWFTEPNGQGTQYTAESTVNQDLTLYACFADQVRVSFIVKDDDGNVISSKSQFFVDLTAGDQITTMPDDPFVEGKVFDYWADPSGNPVEVGYTVTESFDAVAVFKEIDAYELTVNYYYLNDQGKRVDIGSQVYGLAEGDFPYTVTAPGYTIATQVTDEPTYYPSQPTITVTKDQFAKEGDKYTLTVEDEFVAADANYTVGHYLKDLNGEGYTLIETVDVVGVKNSKVTPGINNYSYAEYDHRDENVTITGDANQELKVYYNRRNFTLSYNVGGGEYIEAVTEPFGTVVALPTTATRAGYTFAGWYKDADCMQPAGNSITLEENTTLYAKWNAAQSEYKIVYMIENANDDGYSYLATVTKTAPTDSTVTMTAQTAGASGTCPSDLDTTNFTFKDSTTETVAADGTTVVTVRYSRNAYTLQGRTSSDYGFYYTDNIPGATVTAKYGSDITQAWTNVFNSRAGSWSFDNQNNSKFKSLTIMPGLDVREYGSGNTIYVFNHSDNASYYQHLEYWLQNYTGPGVQTITRNGKTYGRVRAVDMQYNYLSDTDDWYEITGYTKAGYTAEHSKKQNGSWQSFTYTWNKRFDSYQSSGNYKYTRFNFYYDAQEYPLTFYNYDGTLISTQDITLGNDISSYLTSNVPDAPMGGATWKGWYTDQAHTSAYSGGTKMPAGLVLYGNFEFPSRTVTFDSQGGSAVASQTDEHGFYATTPPDPTREHYTFQGWYTAADETGSPYDWNQPVTEDITLYAHWTQDTISYTVHYYETGTTTSVLPDKVVSDPDFAPGREITENAPTVAGHVPDETVKTTTLSFDEASNTITFYYSVIPSELTYTVNYVLQGTNIKVAESKTVTVPGSTTNVMEMAVEVDAGYLATQTTDPDVLGKHYRPTETTKELQLALDNNVITFEYIPFTTTKITVNYLDMDGNPIDDPDTTYIEKGDTFTVQNKAPNGFVYHHAYLAGTTTAPQATYQITGNEGDLTINVYYQRKLIILAKNKSKTYDGAALTSSFVPGDYSVTGLARGDTLASLQFAGSQTDAGTSATTPKNAVITLGGTATTAPESYYSIIYVPGSLTVKPASVYISVSADQWNTHSGGTGPNYYTGQTFNVGFTNPNKPHFNDGGGSAYVSITSGQRDLFKAKYGEAIWAALYGENGALITQKDAGTYTFSGAQQKALLSAIEVDGQAMMSDPNYSIVLNARDSFLTITPLPLTVTTPSDEKAYDGTALTKEEGATLDHSYWTANIGGTWTEAATAAPGSVTLGTGETITFEVTGSQTEVGDSPNAYNIEWGDVNPSNYRIVANLGTLTVTEANLTVTVKDKSVTYNGETQSGYGISGSITGTGSDIETADYTVTGLANGDVLTVTYTPAVGTLVGTYENGAFEPTFTIMRGDTDVTEFYIDTLTPGTLTITDENVDPSLVVTKSHESGQFGLGDVVTFDITVKNIYNEAKDIQLSEIDGVTLTQSTFTGVAAGATVTTTATYTITAADIAAQTFTNTVTAKFVDNNKTYTASDTVKPEELEDPTPELTVTKTASKTTDAAVGDVITYTVVVENTGNVTVTGIAMSDTLVTLTGDNAAAFDLEPGAEKEITYTYTVTQADVDNGSFTNTATASGVFESQIVSDDDSVTVNTVEAEAALTVTKTASKTTDAAVGETVTYTVVVTNSGNVTVSGITLSDTLVTLNEAAFDLAPGAEKEFTYTYTVKQSDVDAGSIDNTVTVTGKDPKNEDVTGTASATVTAVTPDAKLTVTKTADPTEGVAVGDTVTYTVKVENTGNVTVSGIALSDTLVTLNEAAFTLSPNEYKTVTYTYTVTQGDVDKGSIDNTVTATGKDPGNKDVTGTASATVTTEEADPELTVTKTANPTSNVAVGSTVTYTVVVTNSGNVTVTGIALSDTLVTLTEAAFDLAPGASKTVTYTYEVTQADVDAGQIDNTATATGKDPGNKDVTGTASATVTTVESDAKLTVTKTANPASNVKVGDTVTYTVVVTNSGNVTVKGIALSDTLVTLTEAAFDLAPGASKTVIYTYEVTQADVDKGQIDNTVTAKGTDPKGKEVNTSANATVTTVTAEPALTVTKTANPTYGVGVDDVITYTVVVKNTGNVTVTGIALSDTLVTLNEAAFDLAPGAEKEITYTYEVTQADVDKGSIDNTATATGKDPKNEDVTGTASATVTTVTADPELTVTKTADPTSGVGVDDVITYTVKVENTGNVTVSDIALTDTLVSQAGSAFTLTPGSSKTISYTYTVTQADVDKGQIDNTATATGKDPKGTEVTDDATATVATEAAEAELSITKTASPTSGVAVGDTVTYTITVTNSGNVTVKDIKLTEQLAGVQLGALSATTLAPGETATATATYTVTQGDVDAGEIVNVVKANGTAERGDNPDEVTATATVTTEAAEAELSITKAAAPTSGVAVGDTVTYTVVVKNTGNVTVKAGTLEDDHADLSSKTFALAPGEEATFTYTYEVTQADVDEGEIVNVVKANATAERGDDPAEVTATATVTTEAAEAALSITKTASPTSGVEAGDTVTYTVVVKNTGNVSVKAGTLADDHADLSGKIFALAPGEEASFTYTYEVTQGDVDEGSITNVVKANATAERGDNPDEVEATATVTAVEPAAALTVEKSANPSSDVKVGETVTYTVVVTNSGNVTVSGIGLEDTLVPQTGTFALAPNASKTVTYTYEVTQADIDKGSIANTATATGKDPKGTEVKGSDDATVTTEPAAPQLKVTKTADPAEDVEVGDTVEYDVVVENTGNVTVTGIELEDTLVTLEEAAFDLAPDAKKTITYTYTVTQADVDNGEIENTATATGKDPKGTDVTASNEATVTTVKAAPALTVEKTAAPTENVEVDDTVTYTVKVTNSGNVTVTGIALTDSLVTLNEAAFDLAPGAEKEITYTYTVTQGDVDEGKIDNTATATGKDPSGEDVTASDEATVTTVKAAPALTVEKTADPTENVKVGDTVTYTVVVTNSGNVTVSDITLSDTLVTPTGANAEAFDLAPAGTKTFTYTYTVTQADVDAGEIENTATATGKDPKGTDVTASDEATVKAVKADPKLTVEKTASPTSGIAVGSKVTYTVVVTNSGNVTVTGIELDDTLVTLEEAAFDLAPGTSKTVTYEYTATQADVDESKIDNTATATGKDPSGEKVTASDDETVTTVESEAALTVEKTADPTSDVKVGGTVTYTVVVTNTGNVTVKGIALTDSLVTLNEAAFDLAPEESKTVTYTYTVTQADVDAGVINNTATATGKDPKGKEVSTSDSAEVTTVKAEPALTVEKTADPTSGVEVGDTVTYTVVVTNSGNVTVSGIAMTDSLVTLSEEAFTLAPAGTKTITYTYTVTQADVDAGKIDNTATATGKDPSNKDVTASDDATVTTVKAEPALTVEKTAAPTEGVEVDDTVTYTVVVTNSGNVTVKGIELEDALMAAADTPEAFDLAPAGTKTITYTYTVTQADVDKGSIENTATATGKDPKNNPVTASDDATVTTVEAAPELTVTKTADPTSGVEVGDTVEYDVVVENTGNVTVTGIELEDTLVTLTMAAFDLAPGAKRLVSYTYEVTQADVDAGKIDNTATATGTDPSGEEVADDASATVTTVTAAPELTVEKTAEPTSDVKVGDTVEYTVVVTNSGNVTVSDIAMTDSLVTLSEDAFTLAPAGTKTFTYTYEVTQADVDAGEIENTATATGKDPKGAEVKGSDDATVKTVAAEAKLSVTKTAEPTKDVKAGDEITYTVVVKNEGNVTVKAGTLEDDHADLSDKTFELAPGASETFTYTYTVTQADVDAGEVVNVVKANATAARGDNPAEVEATATVTAVAAEAEISVTKTADPTKDVAVGDEIEYTVVVTNTGNVSVKAGTLEDDHADLSDKTFALAPNETATFTYTYTVTQADVDAGEVVNVVKANATAARGENPDEATATATVTTEEAEASFTVDKTASQMTGAQAGNDITYTVTVENTGNVTLKNFVFEDTLVDVSDKTIASLAPGASVRFTYTYTVTQDDVDSGSITNVVTANATAERGDDPEEQQDSVTVTAVESDAQLTVTKTAEPTEDVGVGDEITYTVVVKNEGTNVSVKNITLADALMPETARPKAFNLAPGASKTFTYTYTVTQADVDAGEVVNTVTATGTDAQKGTELKDTDTATVTAEEAEAKLSVTKTASPTDGVAVGDEITYTVVVKNEGNVSVKAGTLADDHADLSDKTFELAPGASETFTYTYTVTQADVDAGEVVNVVKANATAVRGDNPDEVEATATVTAEAAEAELSVTKTAEPTSGVAVGDTVTYTVKVTNTGNVSVKDGTLEDDHADLSGETFALAPGEEATFTYTYTVTQADVDEGSVVNVVKANATAVRGDDPAEAEATATVTAEDAEAELSVTKTAEPTEDVAVGDTITYTVKVTNSGNVSVKAGKLADDHADLSSKTFALAPGETAEFTYTYEVTQADVDAGEVVNVVKANATAARGDDPAEATATATVTAEDAEAELSVTKTADPTKDVEVGDTITYTVVVKNEGNVTVKSGTLVDDHADLSDKTFELAPGMSAQFTYTYEVTQDDVDEGSITNVVKANATAVRGDNPDEVTNSVTVKTVPKDAKTKTTKTVTSTGSVEGKYKAGDVVEYEITVKNTGNVTLYNVTIVDELSNEQQVTWADGTTVDASGNPVIAKLAVGQTVTLTATYTVTQDDVDAQKTILNTVTTAGKDPQGGDPTPDDPDPVPVDPTPILEAEAPADVVYNGGEQKEKPTVTDKKTGATLTEGVDYTLSYSGDTTNVTDEGVTVTVTGIGAYAANDPIELTYKITPATLLVESMSAEKTYDGTPLTEPSYRVTVNNGEVTANSTASTVTLLGNDTLGVDVTGSQTLVGTSPNTIELTWADGGTQVYNAPLTSNAIPMLGAAGGPSALSTNYNVTVNVGTLEVTDDNVDPDLVVKKTHEGTDFAEGDTITFTLTATNIYDDEATITFQEIAGVEVAQAVFEGVPAGETVSTTATYVVTKADVEAGEFKNTVTVTITSGDRETTYEDEDTAKMATPEPTPQPKKPELPQTGDPYSAVAIVYMLTAGVSSLAAGLRARRRRWEEER